MSSRLAVPVTGGLAPPPTLNAPHAGADGAAADGVTSSSGRADGHGSISSNHGSADGHGRADGSASSSAVSAPASHANGPFANAPDHAAMPAASSSKAASSGKASNIVQQLAELRVASMPELRECPASLGTPFHLGSRLSSRGNTSHRAGSEAGGMSPSGGRRCPFVIGVAGGTASGKTTVCDKIMQRLHDQCVVMLNQDSYYRPLTKAEQHDVHNYNFDHPDAFDTGKLVEAIEDLKRGYGVDVPIYDFTTHGRAAETIRVNPCDVIIVEGILVLHIEEVRERLNMKVYVDTDDDVRLARRIQRDVACRGRDVAGVIEQYTRFVKPAFDNFVAPSRRHADLIIPWQRGDNIVAIDLITQHIRLKLKQHDLVRIYPNLEVMPSNYQMRGMHTILRDRTTKKNDFVFYADRVNRLVVEAGLGHLPFSEKNVITPTGHSYVGVDFTRGICGVSVIRSGEAMENALRECCQGIKLGKILIHRHEAVHPGQGGQQQEVIYERLPSDIASRYVLLLDPVLGTGHTACRAIEVLLGRGVLEDRILFLCITASPEGIHKVCTAYPAVKVVTSEIDQGLDDNYQVMPGIGEFGDRYFSE